jgi:hypothetical protein
VPSVDVAASAPPPKLDLDANVIRQAIRDSKSANRRLADASGTYFGDDPVSKGEALGKEVAKAGKDDCIRPDENASILSAIVIAYNAIREKCK